MEIQHYNTPVADVMMSIINQKGLKQSAIARKLGISDQKFSDMLNGRRIIKACDIPGLAAVLGVDPNALFDYRAREEGGRK